jgi:hypothetical protein
MAMLGGCEPLDPPSDDWEGKGKGPARRMRSGDRAPVMSFQGHASNATIDADEALARYVSNGLPVRT